MKTRYFGAFCFKLNGKENKRQEIVYPGVDFIKLDARRKAQGPTFEKLFVA